MPDQRPPHLVGDERTTLLELLQFQRESMVRKLDGLSEDDARHSPVASGTTLLWLAKHLAWAESVWVRQRFAGEDLGAMAEQVTPDDTIAGVVEGYRATWALVDAVVLAADLEQECTVEGRPPVSLRWIVMHLLEETARHAGHADILRELIDDQTGR